MIIEMKNSLERINSRFELAEEFVNLKLAQQTLSSVKASQNKRLVRHHHTNNGNIRREIKGQEKYLNMQWLSTYSEHTRS